MWSTAFAVELWNCGRRLQFWAMASTSTEEGDNSVAEPILHSPEGSLSGSVGSSSGGAQRSKNLARTNRRGLSVAAQKEILEDLESAGGLAHVLSLVGPHPISDFCAKGEQAKADIYGSQRTSQRRRVVNKLRHWKELPADEYQALLLTLGICPAPLRSESPPAFVSVPAAATSAAPQTKSPRGRSSRTSPAVPGPVPDEAPSKRSTPKASNTFGGREFTQYREVRPILDASSEEENEASFPQRGATRMSLDMPVGELF